MVHQTLEAAFVPPELLRPVASMEPYRPCWCMSGRKYKFCHFRRERQTPPSQFDLAKETLEQHKKGRCTFTLADGTCCQQPAISAHTVQRGGALTAVAEAGHVIDFKPQSWRAMLDHNGRPPPQRMGLKRASTFPGFCNPHDSTFSTIEGASLSFDRHAALLFAFRASAYELYRKKQQIETLGRQRQLDKGQPFHVQSAMQSYIHVVLTGAKQGLERIAAIKEDYNARLHSGTVEGLRFCAFQFDRVLPIAACGAFYPEFDLNGVPLQKLARGVDHLEAVTMNVAAFGARTSLIFAWTGPADGPGSAFVRSFAALDHATMADALVRVALSQSENVYARPSWWESLGQEARDRLTQLVWDDIPGGRSASPLARTGTAVAEGAIVAVVDNMAVLGAMGTGQQV